MQMANVVAKWERRLRSEGLAPLDQRIGGRTVIRTEIITPEPSYVADPARLADALSAWIRGDGSRFEAAGLALLERQPNHCRIGWTKRRARVLLAICEAMADGHNAHTAARTKAREQLAYRYLRPLFAALRGEETPLGDDADDTGRGD